MAVTTVRLFADNVAQIGTLWVPSSGHTGAEKWKEIAEGKHEAFKGNKNGTAGAELLPESVPTFGAQFLSDATTGVQAAEVYSVEPYVLSASEKILKGAVIGRLNQTVTENINFGIKGNNLGAGNEVKENKPLFAGTGALWASVALAEVDVTKLNGSASLLSEFLLNTCVVALAKAKAVKNFLVYLELEIEITAVTLPLTAAKAVSAAEFSSAATKTVEPAAAEAESSASLSAAATLLAELSAAQAASAASLALSAATTLPMNAAQSVSLGSLGLAAATLLSLNPATSASTSSLSIAAATLLPLQSAASSSQASLSVFTSGTLPMGAAVSSSSASLSMGATKTMGSMSATAASGASLSLTAPVTLPLQTAQSASTARLSIVRGELECVIAIHSQKQTKITPTSTKQTLITISSRKQVSIQIQEVR